MSDSTRTNSDPSIFEVLRHAPITAALMITCVAVFAVAESHGDTTTSATLLKYGASERGAIWAGQYWRLFTAMFLHVGLLHLVWNLWGLYSWTPSIERALGKARFLVLYLGSGLVASAVSVLGHDVVAAGASGAGFGVVGAWYVDRFRMFGSVRAMFNDRTTSRNMWMTAIWIAIGTVSPMDNYAHIGGWVAGILLTQALSSAPGSSMHRARYAVFAGLAAIVVVSVLPMPWADRQREGWFAAKSAYETGGLKAVQDAFVAHSNSSSWRIGARPWRQMAAYRERHFSLARTDAEAMIREGSAEPEIYLTLGYSCLTLEDLACAREALETATRQDPGSQDAWLYLAKVQVRQDDPEGALRSLEKAGEQAASSVGVAVRLASLFQTRRFAEANALLDSAKGGHTDETTTLWRCLIVARTEPSQARADCEDALRKDSENPSLHLARARIALSDGQFDEALKHLKHSVSSTWRPEASESRALEALAQLALGHRMDARRDASTALELDPSSPLAEVALHAATQAAGVMTERLTTEDGKLVEVALRGTARPAAPKHPGAQ